jgi:glyoxylase I family protein
VAWRGLKSVVVGSPFGSPVSLAPLTFNKYERAGLLGLQLLMRTETFCALKTGSDRLQAMFLTTHEGAREGPFSEFTVSLDHVCLNVDSAETLAAWRRHLEERGAAHSYQRSEWGHHINLRDPDNIAVELFLLEPDEASAEILTPGRRHFFLMHCRAAMTVAQPE